MADPAVCGFLTGLLCAHEGRLALRELLGLIELSEEQLLEVLSEAGPERFVLLDPDPDAGPTVLATTPVRVCRRVTCGGTCEALHLCKLNLLGRCRRESNYCKYSHDIHSEKNIKILKKHDISVLSKNELAVLLLQSDPFFLPDWTSMTRRESEADDFLQLCFTQFLCKSRHHPTMSSVFFMSKGPNDHSDWRKIKPNPCNICVVKQNKGFKIGYVPKKKKMSYSPPSGL